MKDEVLTLEGWLNHLAEGSRPNFLHNLNRFLKDTKYPSWKALIEARIAEMRSDNPPERIRTARRLESWAKRLNEREGLNPETCKFACRCVASFLSYMGCGLDAPLKPSFEVEGPTKVGLVPTPDQLIAVCRTLEKEGNFRVLYLVRGLAMSGLSISDFLTLSWTDGSPQYGAIKAQMEDEKRKLVHLRLKHGRKKSSVQFDTFLSSYTKEDLQRMAKSKEGRILNLASRRANDLVNQSMATIDLGVNEGTRCGTRELRAYFISTLDNAGARTWAERWSGHKLPRLESAYGAAARERGGLGVIPVQEQEAKYRSLQKFPYPNVALGPRGP